MISQTRSRCWVTVDQHDEPVGAHHRTEQAAGTAYADFLLLAGVEFAQGTREWPNLPVWDMFQLDGPCWMLRCDGCRRQLVVDDRRHWPSAEEARRAATLAGWVGDRELCDDCSQLVSVLRPRSRPRAAARSYAG